MVQLWFFLFKYLEGKKQIAADPDVYIVVCSCGIGVLMSVVFVA